MKGYMANLFKEIPKHISGANATEVQKIKSTTLNNALLCKVLHDNAAGESLVQLVDTIVEIC